MAQGSVSKLAPRVRSEAWVVVRGLGDSSPETFFLGYPGFLQPDVYAAGIEEVGRSHGFYSQGCRVISMSPWSHAFFTFHGALVR